MPKVNLRDVHNYVSELRAEDNTDTRLESFLASNPQLDPDRYQGELDKDFQTAEILMKHHLEDLANGVWDEPKSSGGLLSRFWNNGFWRVTKPVATGLYMIGAAVLGGAIYAKKDPNEGKLPEPEIFYTEQLGQSLDVVDEGRSGDLPEPIKLSETQSHSVSIYKGDVVYENAVIWGETLCAIESFIIQYDTESQKFTQIGNGVSPKMNDKYIVYHEILNVGDYGSKLYVYNKENGGTEEVYDILIPSLDYPVFSYDISGDKILIKEPLMNKYTEIGIYNITTKNYTKLEQILDTKGGHRANINSCIDNNLVSIDDYWNKEVIIHNLTNETCKEIKNEWFLDIDNNFAVGVDIDNLSIFIKNIDTKEKHYISGLSMGDIWWGQLSGKNLLYLSGDGLLAVYDATSKEHKDIASNVVGFPTIGGDLISWSEEAGKTYLLDLNHQLQQPYFLTSGDIQILEQTLLSYDSDKPAKFILDAMFGSDRDLQFDYVKSDLRVHVLTDQRIESLELLLRTGENKGLKRIKLDSDGSNPGEKIFYWQVEKSTESTVGNIAESFLVDLALTGNPQVAAVTGTLMGTLKNIATEWPDAYVTIIIADNRIIDIEDHRLSSIVNDPNIWKTENEEFIVASQVDLEVYQEKNLVNDDENAVYSGDTHPKFVVVFNPSGEYSAKIVGTKDETYSFVHRKMSGLTIITQEAKIDIPIKTGEVHIDGVPPQSEDYSSGSFPWLALPVVAGVGAGAYFVLGYKERREIVLRSAKRFNRGLGSRLRSMHFKKGLQPKRSSAQTGSAEPVEEHQTDLEKEKSRLEQVAYELEEQVKLEEEKALLEQRAYELEKQVELEGEKVRLEQRASELERLLQEAGKDWGDN